MRMVRKNKCLIHYSNYVKSEPIVDEWGNESGESVQEYCVPKPFMVHKSPHRGSLNKAVWGVDFDYDLVLIGVGFPFQEMSRLWVDRSPVDENGQPAPHDYIVKRVSRGLSVDQVAIKRVNVS